jgi:hypothetical protein
MDATKVRKSLEYIDDLISKLENDQGFNQTTWIDARRGYKYLKHFMDNIPEVFALMELMGDGLGTAHDSLEKLYKEFVWDEPKDSHLF